MDISFFFSLLLVKDLHNDSLDKIIFPVEINTNPGSRRHCLSVTSSFQYWFYLHSASSSKHQSFCSLLRSLERKIGCKQKMFLNDSWTVAGLHHIMVDVCHNYTNHLLVEYLVSYLTALRQPKLSVQPFTHLWKAALVVLLPLEMDQYLNALKSAYVIEKPTVSN